MLPSTAELLNEISFKTSRSGGKGGQHVNKVSTKVELIFNLSASVLFSPEQKELLSTRLANKIDAEGNIHVICQDSRSQLSNKEKSIEKLLTLLINGLKVDKPRKATKIPKAVIQKRLSNKSAVAEKKQSRKKPSLD